MLLFRWAYLGSTEEAEGVQPQDRASLDFCHASYCLCAFCFMDCPCQQMEHVLLFLKGGIPDKKAFAGSNLPDQVQQL